MIVDLQITSLHFKPGIPRPGKWAPWHKENTTINTMYPDLSGKTSYTFNSLGYRDKEWTDDDINNSIWCVGHSDTMGMGVDIQDRYSSKLIYPTINLGIAGASYDTFSRVICNGLLKYKPKTIILQGTTKERKEYITDDFQQLVLPSFPKELLPHKDVWKYSDDSTATYDFERNISLIKYACKSTNTRLIMFDITDRWEHIKLDPAYDNQHIGPRTHTMISDYLNNILSI